MERRYKNILVAVDGSDQSEKAFVEALNMSKEHQAHLFVACIINDVEIAYSVYDFPYSYHEIIEKQKEEVEKEILKKIYDAREFGIDDITPIVELGSVKEYLTKTIPEERKIDLIIVGATGKGALTRVLVGSTAAYVVNHAPCTVVVVK